MNITHTVLKRFLSYAKIDTQSDPTSLSIPSTEKQKTLGNLLVKELLEMGVSDAHLDEFGYVYATIQSNTEKEVPVICFCAHMDTSPDCSGQNVRPLIHQKYTGDPIVLPADKSQVLTTEGHPGLSRQIGNDIVTADGTTLLGADNKAGLAEIMDAVHCFTTHPEVKHGTLKILFTPDEEIGRGADKVDIEKLGADYGYTIDGEELGHMENETFSADGVRMKITGVSTHPGFAKGKMESAIKIACDIVAALPKNEKSPETTEGKQGFIHPVNIEGATEESVIEFIIRSFDEEGLHLLEKELKAVADEVLLNYPGSKLDFEVQEQYRNMKKVLDRLPAVTDNAMDAMRRAGIEPVLSSIRGGTDGSRLSFMGLPCPNIFAGEHAFHSKQEWVSVQDMEKAVATIVNLAIIWEERA